MTILLNEILLSIKYGNNFIFINNISYKGGENVTDVWTTLGNLLPEHIKKGLDDLPEEILKSVEEIRLRSGQTPTVLLPRGEIPFGMREVLWNDIAHVLDKASRSSLHSVSRQLRRGYISASGGVRIGICGKLCSEGLESYQDVSSLAIRIPHEMKGVGAETINALAPFDSSVLIVSPPGGGKTTFLRELIRVSSDMGKRVAVCDERNEIASMWKGRASFDLGKYTDILVGAGKAEGISMLNRSMNPEIIAVDEISAEEDVKAIEQAIGCGANIFASVHGADMRELRKRPAFALLFSLGIFRRAVIISGREKRNYELVNL